MILDDLAIEPYRLRLKTPWRSARGDRVFREGWLLRARSRGIEGVGDCAPLPGAGTEKPDEALAWLRRAVEDWRGREAAECLDLLDGSRCTPAARCGIETALLDLLARGEGLPLARLLARDAMPDVAANASLGAADEGLAARCAAAVEQGFAVLKIKVAIAALDAEIESIREAAASLPPWARLRLDANRGWGESDARRALAALAAIPLEAVEEPLAEPSLETLAALQRDTPCAIAVDESLRELGLRRILESRAVRRIVLKPMALGGLRATLEAARRIQAAGLEWVVTTTVDSAVGCWAAAHVAAALPGDCVHGLATSRWLAEDVAPPLRPVGGRIVIPRAPGLGLPGPVVVPPVALS